MDSGLPEDPAARRPHAGSSRGEVQLVARLGTGDVRQTTILEVNPLMFTYKIIDVQATVAQPGKLRVVLLSEMGVQIVVYCKKNLKGHLRPGFTIKFHTWDDSPFEWIENSIGGLNPIDGD